MFVMQFQVLRNSVRHSSCWKTIKHTKIEVEHSKVKEKLLTWYFATLYLPSYTFVNVSILNSFISSIKFSDPIMRFHF